MTHIILNGQWMTRDAATVSCADRGFRFGDGVFETVAIHDGAPYQWPLHHARLIEGLEVLKIPAYHHDFKYDIDTMLTKLHVANGFIRISVSRGVGSIGYRPLPNITPTIVVEFIPRILNPLSSARLWLSTYHKPAPSAFPVGLKTAQGLNSTLALLEADEHECDEALLLSHDGDLCEAASGNLFWFSDRTLYTPSLTTGCLNGTTRSAILRLSPYPIQETIASMDVLSHAECVFLTNCNWLVLAVDSLTPNGWSWPSDHPVIVELKSLIENDIKNHHAERHHD